jgi:hypothetical protein
MPDRPRGQRYAAFAAVLAIAAAAPAQCSAAGHGAPGHSREHRYAQRIFGGSSAEQGCLSRLWDRESGWDPYAVNPGSGAYGIPQALPSAHGHPYALGDWKAQIRWGRRYILRRYGTPCAALAHETANDWY